jgi:LPS-assembly protein
VQYLFCLKIESSSIERRTAILTNSRAIQPIISIICLFLFILAPGASSAGEDFLKDGLLIGTWHLSADKALFDSDSGVVIAEENVRLETESSDDVLECRKGVFNLNDQTGEMLDGVLYLSENNFHVRGAVIQKAANETYRVEDFRLTTCDNEAPSWSITGSELNVVMEGYGKIKNSAFRIKNIPVFYLPYLIFPAKTKRQTGLLIPQFDHSYLNGYGVEIPFFWAISDHSDATLYERYINNRGFMQGLEFRYTAGKDSKGELVLDFLMDRIKEKDLTDLYQAEITPFERNNQGRYWLRGRFDRELYPSATARLDLDFVSDHDYLREFAGEYIGFEGRPNLADDFGRPIEERYSSFRRSALRISRDGEDYSLQGSGYYYQTHKEQGIDDLTQPLAGVFYSLLPKQLKKLPFFFNADMEYNYLWRNKDFAGHSLSISPEIIYPMQLGDYLKLESSFGYTANLTSYYVTHGGERNNMVKDAYQAKVGLSTVLERIFAIGGRNITRLKHKVTPSLAYEYRVLPDDQDESPWFDPVDSGSKIHRIGLSVENLLDASLTDEKGGVSYRQWARFDITQRYDLDILQRDDIADEDKKVWEPLLGTLILRPLKGLDLKGTASWDHYEDRLSTMVLSANLSNQRSGGTNDLYYIDYVKSQDNHKSLNLRANLKLIDGFSAGGLLNRALDLKYNIHKSLWVKYQAQCWSIKLGIEKEDADRRIIWNFELTGL